MSAQHNRHAATGMLMCSAPERALRHVYRQLWTHLSCVHTTGSEKSGLWPTFFVYTRTCRRKTARVDRHYCRHCCYIAARTVSMQ